MTQSKIFFGTFGADIKSADKRFNEWIQQNPNIKVHLIQFQQCNTIDHSIFLLYETPDENEDT